MAVAPLDSVPLHRRDGIWSLTMAVDAARAADGRTVEVEIAAAASRALRS
jgi:hypothetical protein